MSDVIHSTPQEFWRPPVAPPDLPGEAMAGTCDRCGTEFMVGSAFCHTCGASRAPKAAITQEPAWSRALELLQVLEFHRVQAWLGLSTASLLAFLFGIGCLLGALAVGMVYSVQNLADFQAIQLWRIQWLLGALVSFVAGILLKRTPSQPE